MSAQLSQTLKDSKLSFKSVLEHLYEKEAELVNKMITDLETNKPAKKTMTQDEKDERKRVTKHKNAQEDDEEILLKAQEDDEEILLKAQEDDEEILLEDHEEFC
jgi:hypothetical protein